MSDPWGEIDVAAAAPAIQPFIRNTPLILDPRLSEALGTDVHLKLENLQRTGSFKVRGAAARMATLSEAERAAGVVTCSSGNHGRAVAFVAHRMGVAATVCVPEWVDPTKLQAIEASGGVVDRTAATYDDAEARAAKLARDRGLTLVHPFDDPVVVAGQGTIALEVLSDLPDVGTLVVPLSGGGLCGGIALALNRLSPHTETVAVSAERAATMLASLDRGQPIEVAEEPTIANALAGGIGLRNRWTFELIRGLVKAHVRVSEEEIVLAMRHAAENLHVIVEGGGAVGLAAALAGRVRGIGGPVAIVVSGGNVDSSLLAAILTDPASPAIRES